VRRLIVKCCCLGIVDHLRRRFAVTSLELADHLGVTTRTVPPLSLWARCRYVQLNVIWEAERYSRLQGRGTRRVEFILVYNPHSGASKTVVFLDDGQIGAAGRNNNEDTWRIRKGCLEFLTDDGKVYSRFRFDKTTGRLACTNDPDLGSLFNQYLFPQY
jgi:hypothetical protein